MKPMSICLWFDQQAEEAARFYVSIFKDGKLGNISYYGKAGHETHKMPEGLVMTVEFEMNGQKFIALNGGPVFIFSEAISLVINCDTQDEIDHFWKVLIADGGREVECGWLRDKFGLSWQVVPVVLGEMMADPDKSKRECVMEAFMKMKKFFIADLEKAYEGKH